MSGPDIELDALLAALADALGASSPVQSCVLQAGYAAFTWRTIDAELAALTYDSRSDASAVLLTRSAEHAGLTHLRFASPSLTIELEIAPTGVVGQLVPAEHADMVLTQRGGLTVAVEVDDIGCFSIDPLPEVSFRLEVSCQPNVVTDWIPLTVTPE